MRGMIGLLLFAVAAWAQNPTASVVVDVTANRHANTMSVKAEISWVARGAVHYTGSVCECFSPLPRRSS